MKKPRNNKSNYLLLTHSEVRTYSDHPNSWKYIPHLFRHSSISQTVVGLLFKICLMAVKKHFITIDHGSRLQLQLRALQNYYDSYKQLNQPPFVFMESQQSTYNVIITINCILLNIDNFFHGSPLHRYWPQPFHLILLVKQTF